MSTTPRLPDYATLAAALKGRHLPTAILLLDVLEANAQSLLQRAGALPLRLLSSSLRCAPLLLHVQGLDPRWQGLLCHDAGEAVWLAQQGFDDIILSTPCSQEAPLHALARQAALGKRISLVVDNPEQINAAEDAARAQSGRLDLLLDLNLWTRLAGSRAARYRSALRDPRYAAKLAKRIASSSSLVRLRGVLAYEALLADPMAQRPGVPGLAARRRLEYAQRATQQRRQEFIGALHDAGFDPELVLAGDSRSLESVAGDRTVNQLCAGSGLYQQAAKTLPALLLALPVQRRIGEDIVVCSSGLPGLQAQSPSGAKALRRLEQSGARELPLRLAPGDRLPLDAPVFFSPASAAELVEHCDRLLVVQGDRVLSEWPTYRGEQRLFL